LEALTIHSCCRVVAIDVHGLVKVVMSIHVDRAVFSAYPACTSVFAIQAAPAHGFLLKELMTAPITMPIRNARQ